MKTRNLLQIATVAAIALMACLSLTIPADALAHCAGKHTGNHPHCSGGGGGGGDLPLRVTFRCDDPTRICPDRMQGDGDGDFVNGVDKVGALITSNGRFRLNSGGNKKHGSEREVYVDYTEGAGSFVPMTSGDVTTTDALPFVHRTQIHVNRRNDIADLRDIEVGNGVMLDIWIDVAISDGGDVSIVWVRGDSQYANTECPAGAGSSGAQDVLVTRNSDTQWTIDAPPDWMACVSILDNEDNSQTGVVRDYFLGPFQLELNAL